MTVNSYPCHLAPCQLLLMPTRTYVSSYRQEMSTRTPSDVNSYYKWCQLVPNKAGSRWWYELISLITQHYVNSYPFQLVPLTSGWNENIWAFLRVSYLANAIPILFRGVVVLLTTLAAYWPVACRMAWYRLIINECTTTIQEFFCSFYESSHTLSVNC